MMDADISVIIPVYNHAHTIAACLHSILAQTLHPREIIIVDDGSIDDLLTALAPFSEKITLLRQANAGSNAARNRGFAASKSALVIFVDADLVMQPDLLAREAAALLAHPEVSYVYSGFRFGWKKFTSFSFSPVRLRRHNFIHTTALMRRAHFPGFDESLSRLQDWDLWLSMLAAGHLGLFLNATLFSVKTAGRPGISHWRPAFMYSIPWQKIGWMPKSMREYFAARAVIARKHNL